VNTWWISDDTRYSYKAVHDEKRLTTAMKTQYGTQVAAPFTAAREAAETELKNLAKANGPGSLYAVLSPMMASEEAWLLGRWIRSIDPQALLVLGPVPTSGQNEIFKHYMTGKQTFEIQAEKVPNKNGINRVLDQLGGPRATFPDLLDGKSEEIGKLKGGWIVGGYLSNWIPLDPPALFKRGFRVVQDILPNSLTKSCDVLLPAAAWAEKDGCWENFAGKIQPFQAAIAPPEGARREGDVYFKLLGRPGQYNAADVRTEMGGPLAQLKLPEENAAEPVFEFVEL
jgi:NADH-quinone oxidoreductase subunit G